MSEQYRHLTRLCGCESYSEVGVSPAVVGSFKREVSLTDSSLTISPAATLLEDNFLYHDTCSSTPSLRGKESTNNIGLQNRGVSPTAQLRARKTQSSLAIKLVPETKIVTHVLRIRQNLKSPAMQIPFASLALATLALARLV